ncbi:hypothetical protein M885DRAFT_504899 [Pelagophyceae sp. CCMP2097]|nr:hypothetical protein M885DRAFT_504899 [Pelagophyceae sp. CCMP2097]
MNILDENVSVESRASLPSRTKLGKLGVNTPRQLKGDAKQAISMGGPRRAFGDISNARSSRGGSAAPAAKQAGPQKPSIEIAVCRTATRDDSPAVCARDEDEIEVSAGRLGDEEYLLLERLGKLQPNLDHDPLWHDDGAPAERQDTFESSLVPPHLLFEEGLEARLAKMSADEVERAFAEVFSLPPPDIDFDALQDFP